MGGGAEGDSTLYKFNLNFFFDVPALSHLPSDKNCLSLIGSCRCGLECRNVACGGFLLLKPRLRASDALSPAVFSPFSSVNHLADLRGLGAL